MDPTSTDSNPDQNDGGGGGGGRGSIAERRAAKCGFKAERINTARFRTDRDGPLCSSPPVLRSPLLTIPPGISPTALLDSPILLPNSQPSPTTGSFRVPFADGGGCFGSSGRVKDEKDFGDSFPEFSGFLNQGNDGDLHCLVSGGTLVDFEFPTEFPKGVTEDDSVAEAKVLEGNVGEACFVDSQERRPEVSPDPSDQQKEPACGGSVEVQPPEEQKGAFPAADMGRTSEDGYNWRKYGQKQVKGSEYPRSYYKCTHTNCQVKKKIERSHDGQITEIIYKGTHNHPKPQPNRRALPGSASSLDGLPETEEDSGTSAKPEGVGAWRSAESGSRDVRFGVSERRFDGLERTSSTSVVTELSDPLSTTHGRSVGAFEPVGTPELSSTLASLDDNDDDGTTQASPSVGLDFDDEESESKRRRLDSCLVEANITSRAVREPRVVVQIESEVDILDDGYRWRKYGQKVVKGNPNPRSYYKCTSPGCSVRKHVERASHNLKYVITTYEGKHNHEVPAARNSTHANPSGGSLPPNPSNAQTGVGFGRNTQGPKSDSQIQEFAPTFDRKPVFNDYLRPAFPRNFGNDVRLGASSMIPMKFPLIQSTMPYASFGCNSNQAPIHPPASIASLVPNFPISMPPGIRASPNVSMGGVDFCSNGKFTGPVQPFLAGQQLIRPKQEQKDNVYDVGSSITGQANVSSGSASSSLYQHIMGNFSS